MLHEIFANFIQDIAYLNALKKSFKVSFLKYRIYTLLSLFNKILTQESIHEQFEGLKYQ